MMVIMCSMERSSHIKEITPWGLASGISSRSDFESTAILHSFGFLYYARCTQMKPVHFGHIESKQVHGSFHFNFIRFYIMLPLPKFSREICYQLALRSCRTPSSSIRLSSKLVLKLLSTNNFKVFQTPLQRCATPSLPSLFLAELEEWNLR